MSVVFISSRFRLNRDGSPPSSFPQSKTYTRTEGGDVGFRCAPTGGRKEPSSTTAAAEKNVCFMRAAYHRGQTPEPVISCAHEKAPSPRHRSAGCRIGFERVQQDAT